jgi:aspartate ammonia-lyase
MSIHKSTTLISKADPDLTVSVDDIQNGIYQLSDGQELSLEQLTNAYEIMPMPAFNINMPELQVDKPVDANEDFIYEKSSTRISATDYIEFANIMKPMHALQDAFDTLNSTAIADNTVNNDISLDISTSIMSVTALRQFKHLFKLGSKDMSELVKTTLTKSLILDDIVNAVTNKILDDVDTPIIE